MSEPKLRFIEANGIRMHIAEQGSGPLVLLCHGLPESWYSWRHQLKALAEAGYHAVAPDMRGYGQTDAPEEIDQYTLLHLVGDMVGLLDALGDEQAVIAGHDWGAPVAWHAALLRPDRFRGGDRSQRPVSTARLGAADQRHAADRRRRLLSALLPEPGRRRSRIRSRPTPHDPRACSFRLSGDVAAAELRRPVRRHGSAEWRLPDADCSSRQLPSWLTEADIDFYAGEFARTGFRGGLNWYRNIDRNWELLAPFAGLKVTVPALYVAGDRDLVVAFRAWTSDRQSCRISSRSFAERSCCPSCGHWTQQERASEVNAAMIDFLAGL